ncbi:M48 family metalloprotease [uncultured Psychrosphaera sp.]|uniref:beta-barrel assembly-enhancing protease n=1 Tax=uncultured Psychrosphaera sp. TaxID=1403522 RepID=UPI00262DA401|nr:M48 family metalloprotease [uncultured Psychrosphaera sp.]
MYKKITSTFTAFAISVCLFSATSSFAANNELPDLGASALTVLSIEKEKQLGEIIFNQLQGRASLLYDPLVNEYINSVGNKLVAHSKDVNFPFTFFVVNSPDINAFAFYGGYIGVHTGLIASAETESQLASVLGHEIAHVTQRHLARKKQESEQTSNMTLAGIVGSILLAAINPQAMMASLMVTTAGAQQAMINYTRSNEQEADNIGMNILATAGFDPYAAAEFFGKLQEQQRYQTKLAPFLVTHPLADSRVTDAKLRAQQYTKRFYADSIDFLLMRARVMARYIYDKDHVVEIFKDLVKKQQGNKQFAAQYGLALAYLDTGKLDLAEQQLTQLEELTSNNLYILDAQSDLYIAQNKPGKILDKLAYAYQLRPNNSVVTLNYANVLVKNNEQKKAIGILEYYLLSKPNDFLATQLLREAYKADENMARYHITSAELFALRSDYRNAIKSADIALTVLTEDQKSEVKRVEALKIKYRERDRYIKNIKGF